MADLHELKTAVEALEQTVVDFKCANDERLAEYAKKGDVDPLIDLKVEALNGAIDEKWDSVTSMRSALDDRVTHIESALRRSSRSGPFGDEERKEAAQFESLVTKQFVTEDDDLDIDGFNNYRGAFGRYLRKTTDRSLSDLDIKALTIGGDPQGGFYVPPMQSDRIIARIFETSPLRAIANVMTIGSDRVSLPLDRQEAATGWVGETEARAETATPELGEITIPVHEQFANPRVSQNLLDDANFDVSSWIQAKVADKLSRTENAAFVTGDGVKRPRGFLDYAASAATTDDDSRAFGVLQYQATGTNGAFASAAGGDVLVDTVFKLKADFRENAHWVMNRATLGAVRKLKDDQGQYLWVPNFQDLQATSLLGFPIAEAEDMPDIATDSFSIAFGSFNAGYQIVDRQGVRVLVDPFTDKPFVRYYTTKRVGGDVVDSEAIKLIKFATS